MRAILIYVALLAAVVLATPAFWWLVADRTSLTAGEAVEADGVHRTVMTGPKAPWPDWAWTPAEAKLRVRIWNGAAPGHPANGFGELRSAKPMHEQIGAVRDTLLARGWDVADYHFEGQDPAMPSRALVLCTVQAHLEAQGRTLTYTFTLDRNAPATVLWSEGAPPAQLQVGVEGPC